MAVRVTHKNRKPTTPGNWTTSDYEVALNLVIVEVGNGALIIKDQAIYAAGEWVKVEVV